jgi:hypothetical protein
LDRKERLALLSRDDEAAALYVSRIPEHEIQESWQFIEPSGVRMMHGPAGIRLLEHLPGLRWLGFILGMLRLTPFVTAMNRLLGKARKPLGRFFPNPHVPHRWP